MNVERYPGYIMLRDPPGDVLKSHLRDVVLASDYDALAAAARSLHESLKRGADTVDHGPLGDLQCVHDHMLSLLDEARSERDSLAARLAEAERDAARYRWMAEHWAYADGTIFFDGFDCGAFATLNDAIDAAIAKTKETNT